jgi:glycine cleavage system aminomethyltransferase T
MTAPRPRPVRRSPLEAVHARLGARWRSETERWPASYGDEAGEARVIEDGIALAEPGPYEKLVVRGPSTLAALRSLGLAGKPGFLEPARSIDGINAWVTADDEAYLVRLAPVESGPGQPASPAAQSLDEVAAGLRAEGSSVVDVGSGSTILRLVGRPLPALMQELCPVDTSARAVPDLRIVQAAVVGCRMVIARRDQGEIPGWILLVAREDAEFAWDAIVELGGSYGLRPVGMLAVRPPAAADMSLVAATR